MLDSILKAEENPILNELAAQLKQITKCYVLRHIRPDGDAIGSQYGLVLGLRQLGINAQPLHADPVPADYAYVTDKVPTEDIGEAPYIAVDSMTPARLGSFENTPVEFCIDHHQRNSISAPYKYVEADASACTEMVLRVLLAMGVEITQEIAHFLYIGLLTDTNCFRARSTNATAMADAALLAGCGIDISGIARRHVFYKSAKRIEAEKCLRNTQRYTCNDRVLSCMITWDDFTRIGIDDSQLEGINTLIEEIEGPALAIVLRERAAGICRFSVRAEEGLNASEICKCFNGGGHADAAGCDIEGDPKEAMLKMEKACAEYLAEKGMI